MSPPDVEAPVGVALIAPDDAITMADASARMWLAELSDGTRDGPLPIAVHTVLSQARRIAAGQMPSGGVARAGVRTPSGQWLLLRGSTLGDGPGQQTALIMEPAYSHDLAQQIAESYGLSDRERSVARFVAQGPSTGAIAGRLHRSPRTVQDQLRSLFEKVGVGRVDQMAADVHEHVWRSRSRHPTSDGVLSYQQCDCGRWRLLLGSDHIVAGTDRNG